MSPHRLALAHDDFDAFAADAPNFDLDMRQIDRGPFVSDLHGVVGEKVQLIWSRFSRGLEVGGLHPPGTLTFAICVHDDTLWTVQGLPMRGTDLVMAPSRDEVDMISRRGWSACVVSIDDEHLDAVQARIGVACRIPDRTTRVPFAPGEFDVLRRLCSLTLAPPPGMDVTRTLEEEIPAALIRLLAARDGLAVAALEGLTTEARALLAARARDHIRTVAREAPTVTQLEAALGTSGRTLRRAFREHVGVSPKEYIHAQRLNAVRRDLLRARGNVTEVGSVHGFWHMGQLAADYRRLFGELPSATLRGRASRARERSYSL